MSVIPVITGNVVQASSSQSGQEERSGAASYEGRNVVAMPARDESSIFSYDPTQTFLTLEVLESMKAKRAALEGSK